MAFRNASIREYLRVPDGRANWQATMSTSDKPKIYFVVSQYFKNQSNIHAHNSKAKHSIGVFKAVANLA
jgi:hypothetical protein